MQDRQHQTEGVKKMKKTSFRIVENNHSIFLTIVCKLGHSNVICYCKVWILAITFWTSIAILVRSVQQDRQHQIEGGKKRKKTALKLQKIKVTTHFCHLFAKLSHSDVICYCKGWILAITL
jgi:hypothetical protein